MNNPAKWEIWYVNFRFENESASKDRPALVLEIDGIYYISSMITSHEQRPVWGEYDIVNWQSAGLDHPSTVRLSRIIPIERKDFRRRIGKLSLVDINLIQQLLT